MIALWMMYVIGLTAVFAIAASLLDRAATAELRQRRWIWIVALGLSAVVPAWTSLAPRTGLVQLFRADAPSGERSPNAGLSQTSKSPNAIAELIARAAETESLGRLNWPLGFVWAGAGVLALVGYAAAMWSLARRRRSWRKVEVNGQAVLLAPGTGPAVVGALRPQIVVPEWSLGLTSEKRALMIEHERQHVRARDPLLLHIAALVTLIMPWNLVAWWLNRRLRLAVELDCDARVLAGGHDPRAYGTLLLDVCSRRLQPGVGLSPALFERASSLTRRILAMQPERSRFPRIRLALGVAAAFAIVVIACDVPSPEVLAPDGKNQATKRLYGKMEAAFDATNKGTSAMVARYFPSVARGEDGPSILFVVKSASGEVVLTEAQPADVVLTRVETRSGDGDRSGAERAVTEPGPGVVTLTERAEDNRILTARDREEILARQATERRVAESAHADSSGRALRFKVPARSNLMIPIGISTLPPNDIESVDVMKREPGAVAPNAVSIVTIVLKPGAALAAARKR